MTVWIASHVLSNLSHGQASRAFAAWPVTRCLRVFGLANCVQSLASPMVSSTVTADWAFVI